MSVLIKGIDIPKKHYMNCYYIDDDGKVFDVSRKNVVGKAVQISSAQPERKTGTWELMFNGQFKGGAYWFSCSKCNRIVPEVRNGGWNFCPNCGADMRGEQDEKD